MQGKERDIFQCTWHHETTGFGRSLNHNLVHLWVPMIIFNTYVLRKNSRFFPIICLHFAANKKIGLFPSSWLPSFTLKPWMGTRLAQFLFATTDQSRKQIACRSENAHGRCCIWIVANLTSFRRYFFEQPTFFVKVHLHRMKKITLGRTIAW